MEVYIKGNMIVIGEPKIFLLIFDFLENVDKIMKHKIEFIVSHNETLAEYKIKKRDSPIVVQI